MSAAERVATERMASAEILRLVLAKMGAHAASYGPESYAVFYEYVRGAMPQLRDECDELIATHGRLTEGHTAALYEKHVRTRVENSLVKARNELLGLLTHVQSAVGAAIDDSRSFDRSLDAFSTGIQGDPGIDTLKHTLAQVIADTHSMRDSMRVLNDEIVGNKAELDRLTEELGRLREDVMIDPLTKLTNRRGLEASIAALKTSLDDGGDPFSIVMLDIDRFKAINDQHGHLVGDRVIQQVAASMKSCVRGGDIAARYGGEEFVLLLPVTALKGAQTVADYVRRAIERTPAAGLKPGSVIGTVTISAGVTSYRRGESVEACLGRADEALYAAKNGGRNQVRTLV